MGSQDKVILYTNRLCPWAHRAHIALAELNIPFEEVTIDLAVPRTPEYLAINPRGLVPTLSFNGEIIIESAIVVHFLANASPNHLAPATGTPDAALHHARISLFVDWFISLVTNNLMNKNTLTMSPAELEEAGHKVLDGFAKHLEPLLADANPYFGGSDKLTLAEVLTASFAVRLLSFSKAGILPVIAEELHKKAPRVAKWAEKLSTHPSVIGSYDEQGIINMTKAMIASLKAAA